MKSIYLQPKVDELTRLNNFIYEELSITQYDILLIVEEIFVNIINYSECKNIKILFELKDEKLKMIFIDDGKKFNPLLKEDHDLPESIEDANIGGLGIHFVKNLANEITYDFIDNENHLTVIKNVEE